jgi:hypothetical protein
MAVLRLPTSTRSGVTRFPRICAFTLEREASAEREP